MKTTTYSTLLLVMLLLTACDKKEFEFSSEGEEIRLGCSLAPQVATRATSEEDHLTSPTQFKTDVNIALFLKDQNDAFNGSLYKMVTAAGDKLNFASGSPFWPAGAVNFYAWYPYQDNGPFASKVSTDVITFTVNSDQRSAANYAASDLMCAVKSATKPESADTRIQLDFYHKLSQVIVVLKTTNDQLTDDQLATAQITIDGTAGAPIYLDATVDIDAGTATYKSDGTTTTQLQLGTGAKTFAVLPSGQSLQAKKIRFTLDGIATREYEISQIGNLEAGKRYTITLNLTLSTFTVTEEVFPWQSGDGWDESGSPIYV